MDKKVQTVDWVEARITVPMPPRLGLPQLVVTALGTVPTIGWSNGQLVLRERMPTPEGVYEFDFVATPPTGIAGDVVSPITGSGLVTDPRRHVSAICVFAAGDRKEVPLGNKP